MLLIDDDDAQVRERQEQRRARAGDDPDVALRDASPDAGALATGHAGMPLGRPHAEARGETVEELRCQRDFRHQDERLPPLFHRIGRGDRLEIDLGLAGAGDAFEQIGLEGARRDGVDQRGAASACATSRTGGAKSESGGRAIGSTGSASASSAPQSTSESTTPPEQAAASASADFTRANPSAATQYANAGAGVDAFGQDASRAIPRSHRLRPEIFGRANGHAQHHAARAQRPARDPVDEFEEIGAKRRQVALARNDRLEIGGRRRGAHGPDDAGGFASAERNVDDIAGRRSMPSGMR